MAEVLNYEEEDVFDSLKTMTGGRGPDKCIDAVGLESHGATFDAYVDAVKAAAFLATDKPSALRQAIHACRKGGIVSIPGVYGGFLDKVPFGAAFQKGLTFKMGQTHMMRYMKPLLDRIESGELDPSFVITHRVPLEQAPDAYKIFRDHEEGCIKVVLKPHPETVH
jgi:threonine dehydrogenase-like Zn-dependent dehydrogenase